MPTTTQSIDVIELTTDEDKKLTADFTRVIYGDTLATVVSVAETTSLGLTCSAAAINSSGSIDVDGVTIATSKAVQFMCDATTATDTGDGVIRVIATTTAGNRVTLDCRVRVWE